MTDPHYRIKLAAAAAYYLSAYHGDETDAHYGDHLEMAEEVLDDAIDEAAVARGYVEQD